VLTARSGAGSTCPAPDAWLDNERSNAERITSRLEHDFGGRFVRVRGAVRVCCHLTVGLVAPSAGSLLRFRPDRGQPVRERAALEKTAQPRSLARGFCL